MKFYLLLLSVGLVFAATPAKKKPAAARTAVSPQQRAEAVESIQARVGEAMESGILNAASLVPFFERLYREKQGGEAVHVLHFGDSHSASDDWPSIFRTLLQQKFGDGGPGFTQAGRPFLGYRRYDSKATASKGWKTRGLLNREGDGNYGLSGVAIETAKAGETVTLEAEGSVVQLLYWRQPGGGTFRLTANGTDLSRISTDADSGPGAARFKFESNGPHEFALTTDSNGPVRLFGWIVEKPGGLTWETLGINGAQVDVQLNWNEALFTDHVRRRDPALIVLAYGTNEARWPEWTGDSYRDAFRQVIARLRTAAPAASILVIGPPDQASRVSRGGPWRSYPGVDMILAAQKEVALATGCAFWNWRSAMGGRGSMALWVRAGLAAPDYVHFSSAGYRLLGQSLGELMLSQFDIFATVRRQVMGEVASEPSAESHGPTAKNH